MRRRPFIRQRRRIFLGCEGESERGYAALLSQIVREEFNLSVAINAELLRPGGGDPLALVDLAVQIIARNERNHGKYSHRAVLLDFDRLGQSPNRDQQMRNLARQQGIQLIFQEPTHEALLLRHLEGCSQDRPQTAPQALIALRHEWPEYEKPMAAQQLADRIDAAAVLRACNVEHGLRDFLQALRSKQRSKK